MNRASLYVFGVASVRRARLECWQPSSTVCKMKSVLGITASKRQAKTLASRGLRQFPRSAGRFQPAASLAARMVAVALRITGHYTFERSFRVVLVYFFFSPHGSLLRNWLGSSTLGHVLFAADFQCLAGLSPVVLPASAEAIRGAISRCTSYASTVFGSGWARSHHRVVHALVSRAAFGERSGSCAPPEFGSEPRHTSRG